MRAFILHKSLKYMSCISAILVWIIQKNVAVDANTIFNLRNSRSQIIINDTYSIILYYSFDHFNSYHNYLFFLSTSYSL